MGRGEPAYSERGAIVMAINFPDSPSVGSTFAANGLVWQWDGAKWIPASSSGTSFLSLNGGTMQGPLLLQSDPTTPLGAATKQYVDANYSGFVNKLRNGTMDVWQRGASVACPAGANTYTTDGWIVTSVGAATTVTQGPGPAAAAVAAGPTLQSLHAAGVSGITALAISQRIEASIAAALGATVTFSAWVLNNSGAAIAPQLQVSHPTTMDIAPYSVNDVNPIALQSCANAAWTRIAYTFTIPQASLNLGVQITLMFGAVASGYVRLAAVDIRATPGWPIGLCTNPPPPELRPIAMELALCQRYYFSRQMYTTGYAGSTAAGGVLSDGTAFPMTMRAAPTIALSNLSYGNASSVNPTNIQPYTFQFQGTAAAVGAWTVNANVSASAEL